MCQGVRPLGHAVPLLSGFLVVRQRGRVITMASKNCMIKTRSTDGVVTWQEVPSSADSNYGTDRWESYSSYTKGSAYTVYTDTPGTWQEDWWNRAEWRYPWFVLVVLAFR